MIKQNTCKDTFADRKLVEFLPVAGLKHSVNGFTCALNFLTRKPILRNFGNVTNEIRVFRILRVTEHLTCTSLRIGCNFLHKGVAAVIVVILTVVIVGKVVVKTTEPRVGTHNHIGMGVLHIPVSLASLLTILHGSRKPCDVACISGSCSRKVTTGLRGIAIVPEILLKRLELGHIVLIHHLRIGVIGIVGDIATQCFGLERQRIVRVLRSILCFSHLNQRLCEFIICERLEMRAVGNYKLRHIIYTFSVIHHSFRSRQRSR